MTKTAAKTREACPWGAFILNTLHIFTDHHHHIVSEVYNDKGSKERNVWSYIDKLKHSTRGPPEATKAKIKRYLLLCTMGIVYT